MAVKILIDSASDINKEQAKEMGVELISMTINFGEEEFYDGVDLYPEDFYKKLVNSKDFPRTSQINPFRWEEKFKELTENGDQVVAIVMSSKLSGTYQSAVLASEKFNGVYVIDSYTVAVGERILLEYAISLKNKGLSGKEIADKLEENKNRVRLYAIVNTLEYLKKGGRISATVAFAGELLSIKPVLGVCDGEAKILGKAMGTKRGNHSLNALVNQAKVDKDMPFGALWSGTDSSLLDKFLADSSTTWKEDLGEIPRHIIGCTIGTHAGPGAFGFAFFAKD
ncbi:MAG: DegV family protein [Clostridia bacterium]|nr:DegV family protein [Clostridia bacterium]